MEEILDIGEEKYGFDRKRLASEIRMAVGLDFVGVTKLSDGRLHIEKDWEPSFFREMMIGAIPRMPSDYFDRNPKWRLFYEELDRRYGEESNESE